MEKIVLVKNNTNCFYVDYKLYVKANPNYGNNTNLISSYKISMEKLKECVNKYVDFIAFSKKISEYYPILNMKKISVDNLLNNYKDSGIDELDQKLKEMFKEFPFESYYMLLSKLYDKMYYSYLEGLNISNLFQEINLNSQMDLVVEKNSIPAPNSIAKESLRHTLNTLFFYKTKHKCFNCSNASTLLCNKVANRVKKDINEYPFIEKGFQIKSGDFMERFIVSECTDYVICSDDVYYRKKSIDPLIAFSKKRRRCKR